MKLTDTFISFVKEHKEDDLNRLLLSASRYPEIDVPFAVEQIAARRQIKEKLPLWYKNDRLLFPAKLAAEQCSSEQTAIYKQNLVEQDILFCDLTGGLGIDCYFFSQRVKEAIYIERFPAYCEIAKHNFQELGASNVTIFNADSAELSELLPEVDVFYIDPARRGIGNKRMFALEDCEPDLLTLLPVLLKKASKVIAKLSPMVDISHTLELLPNTTEVHILSVHNECKEMLFIIKRNTECDDTKVKCVNYTTQNIEESFSFIFQKEKSVKPSFSEKVYSYLYEPNASILKGGAFKCVGEYYGVQKLHVSSHLYTSEIQIENFPGRTFVVEDVISFSGKDIKQLGKRIPKANITVRNFPLSVEELRKRTKIMDGGDIYLFATTLFDGEKVLIKCRKLMRG